MHRCGQLSPFGDIDMTYPSDIVNAHDDGSLDGFRDSYLPRLDVRWTRDDSAVQGLSSAMIELGESCYWP